MDGEDFAMPSPKRQRTNSPDEGLSAPMTTLPEAVAASTAVMETEQSNVTIGEKMDLTTAEPNDSNDSNDMLDALMQHVEAETTPDPPVTKQTASVPEIYRSRTDVDMSQQSVHVAKSAAKESDNKNTEAEAEALSMIEAAKAAEVTASSTEVLIVPADESIPEQRELPPIELTAVERAALQIEAIPPTEAIEPVEGEDQPEWEVDSSPYQSSTDSDSSDTTSDDSDDDEDDDDPDGDYAMLDPEEAARILMQGDAGSDDEGDRSKTKGEGSGLRTANEQLEDAPPVPEITITEDEKIEELGVVEATIENNVLIKGKVSGEYQVLESGSLLCLQNRAIAGVVAETLGRVEQPLYTVRFRHEQEIKDHGLSEKGTIVFYVPQHSTFVFTQPLKGLKGSDASNFHDEEVGAEEMEFSDDEAEAEHKRQLKLKRQGRLGDTGKARGAGRGGKGGQRGGYKPSPLSTDTNGAAYGNGSLEMNYDDVEEGEEGYTPLSRPANLHEMTNTDPSTSSSIPSYMPPPPYSDRGRGRGNRNNNRGGRGQSRGGSSFREGNTRGGRHPRNNNNNYNQNNNSGNSFQQPQQHSPTQPQYPNPYPMTFPTAHQYPYPSQQPPSAPSLTPQTSSYPYSMITSPISPLPKQQFGFNAPGFQAPQSYNPNYSPQQQQQQQPQWPQPMPGGFAPQFNNPTLMQFAQQFQQNQQQQQQQQQQQHNGWQVNQAAAAEVQRQLEEMRRAQRGGQ